MSYPVSENYMDNGGDRWTIGPDGELRILGILTGGLYAKAYYVDNVAGSGSNDGLKWSSAFAQISTAIAAWEAYRVLQTNVYARGVIYVRGTLNAYAALTALPNYCDIIGVGADPRGNGAGIARITAANGVDTVAEAVGVRGLGLYNLQFTGSGTGWAMNVAVMFRSIIENCAFVNKSTGGLLIVTGGGITIRNCQFGGDTVTPAIGLSVGSGAGNFNQCLVENNCIYGSVDGVINHAYLSDGTVFRNNTIYGGTVGVLDNSTETNIAGLAFYVGNYISGTDAMAVTNSPEARCIGNSVVNTATGAREVASS